MTKPKWVEVSSLDPPDVVIPKLGSIIYNALYETGMISPVMCIGVKARLREIDTHKGRLVIEWEPLDDRTIISDRVTARAEAAEADTGQDFRSARHDGRPRGFKRIASAVSVWTDGTAVAIPPPYSFSGSWAHGYSMPVDAGDNGPEPGPDTPSPGGGHFSGGGATDSWESPCSSDANSPDARGDECDGQPSASD